MTDEELEAKIEDMRSGWKERSVSVLITADSGREEEFNEIRKAVKDVLDNHD